jgi:hypothetical protein
MAFAVRGGSRLLESWHVARIRIPSFIPQKLDSTAVTVTILCGGLWGPLVALEEKVTTIELKIFSWEVYMDVKGFISQII